MRPARFISRLGRFVDARVGFDLKSARDASVAATRETVGHATRVTRIPAVAKRFGSPRRAGILLYHAPKPEVLSSHLEYLAPRHPFVPYADIARAASTGDWSSLPPRCLAVTFDDGHASNVQLIPLLEAHGITPTIFLCTAIVGTKRGFWTEAPGLSPKERDRLMDAPDEERLETLARLSGWTPETEHDGPPQTLTLEEIRTLASRVDFQAHTRTHPVLTMCPDDKALSEIDGSRVDVDRLGVGPCLDFAYPNGKYGRRELELVTRAGFRSARTTSTGWNDPSTDPFQLRILGMPDDASVGLVAAQSTGIRGLRDLMYMT